MRWKTDEIVKIAAEICDGLDPDLKVASDEAWGDHDSDRVFIRYQPNGEHVDFVSLAAFDTEDCIENKSDCEAEMIEMGSQHADSGGGVMTDHEVLNTAAFRLRRALEEQGWNVVRSMDDYF